MKSKYDDDVICNCQCHRKDCVVRHIMPCCKFTYEQYINVDGSLDEQFYDELMKQYETEDNE